MTDLVVDYCLHDPKVVLPIGVEGAPKEIEQGGIGFVSAKCPVLKCWVEVQVEIEKGIPVLATCLNNHCEFNNK